MSGFASAHARSRIWSSSSAGWAPAAPYLRSTTKNGTPVAPSACAVAPSCRTGLAVGDRGVELEGSPDGLDLVPVRELVEGTLQPALADVAPRTHDVGPDLYLHARTNFSEPSSIPHLWPCARSPVGTRAVCL